MRKILSCEVLSNFRLKITYADGRTIEIDFTNKIEKDTVTESLGNPDFFKQVKITRDGRAIEWPGKVEFCADSLWFEGSGERNPYVNNSEKAS